MITVRTFVDTTFADLSRSVGSGWIQDPQLFVNHTGQEVRAVCDSGILQIAGVRPTLWYPDVPGQPNSPLLAYYNFMMWLDSELEKDKEIGGQGGKVNLTVKRMLGLPLHPDKQDGYGVMRDKSAAVVDRWCLGPRS
jgi:hypothetical protein